MLNTTLWEVEVDLYDDIQDRVNAYAKEENLKKEEELFEALVKDASSGMIYF